MIHSDSISHFAACDDIMASLAVTYGKVISLPAEIKPSDRAATLYVSISSQQLSVKAAATIWSRVQKLCDDWSDPEKVALLSDESLRLAGLSFQKIAYIKNIARGVSEKTLRLEKYSEMEDSEIIDELTQIKGIGRWTAEMFLIFAMGREDVFSLGDLGLRHAIAKHYGELSHADIISLQLKWSPYRSYASLLLWHSLDNK
jgi:DNA-3-methyladenine glycosylase II